MKILLTVILGLYAALGPLCPMQLQAATLERAAQMPMMSSLQHETTMHGGSQHTDTTAHTDCGEEDHCQLGETVDGAGSAELQEVACACFVGVMLLKEATETHANQTFSISMDRPPPLSLQAMVVLRQ